MTKEKLTYAEAMGEYNRAQADEAEARMRGGDPVAIMEAKSRQTKALDALAAQPDEEERVVLISPNPHANVTDSNGLTFVDGRAEDVPLSLARKYAADFTGYTIEGGK